MDGWVGGWMDAYILHVLTSSLPVQVERLPQW